MLRENFVQAILRLNSWSEYTVLKRRHGKVPEIQAKPLLELIFDRSTTVSIAQAYGISNVTINRLLKKLFPDAILTGKRTWKYYLLEQLEVKECKSCGIYKNYKDFYVDNSRPGLKLTSRCKVCNDIKRNIHIEEQPGLRKASLAKRRAAKLKATPQWADLEAIRLFYTKCPKGYEVDHILPLQGETVCGLHILNNLQYLTVAENRAKSNKLLNNS